MAKVTTKKKVTRKRKSKNIIKFLTTKFYVITFSIIFTIGTLFHYREALLYYFSFKTDKIVREDKVAQARIFQILNDNENKVFGFDVSEFQGQIHWNEIDTLDKKFPMHFVFIRATAGIEKKDSRFDENWDQAKINHFVRGAYHYYRPNENSIEQAENFIKTVKLKKGDFPPVLDIEQLPKNQSLDSLKVGLKRWLNIVDAHYEIKPIIYTNEKYYSDFLKDDFPEYKFWVANYNFWIQNIKEGWLFWQFTDKAKLNGIDEKVDINIYNGTPKMLGYMTISN